MFPWRRVGVIVGIAALTVSALPWLGLGGNSFVIPGWNILLPRIRLIENQWLYEAATFPLHVMALIPPLDAFIYFSGEGLRAIRPFVVFLAWFLFGACCLWLGLRKKRTPSAA